MIPQLIEKKSYSHTRRLFLAMFCCVLWFCINSLPQIAQAQDIEIYGLPEDDRSGSNYNDPFENFNRMIFKLDLAADRIILEPIAMVYGAVTPEIGRKAISNIVKNANIPVITLNLALQRRPQDVIKQSARFVLNSTAGFAGAVDVATALGLERVSTNLSATLGSYGVPEGIYILLPFLPPSTLRGYVGTAGEMLFDPLKYFAGEEVRFMIGASLLNVLGMRYEYRDEINALKSTSVDMYAAVRSILYQQMREQVSEVARSRGETIEIDFSDETFDADDLEQYL